MDDTKVSAMPPLKDLIETNLSPKQWLIYYRNIWSRNLLARTIDLQSDITRKAINPEEEVTMDDGSQRPTTVKARLETRKILIEDALEILASIKVLLEVAEDPKQDFIKKYYSKEALAVAPDMLPKIAEVKTGNAPAPTAPEAGGEAKV